MKTYTFRAECLVDALAFITAVAEAGNFVGDVHVIADPGGLPDRYCRMRTNADKAALMLIAGNGRELHVIHDTLAVSVGGLIAPPTFQLCAVGSAQGTTGGGNSGCGRPYAGGTGGGWAPLRGAVRRDDGIKGAMCQDDGIKGAMCQDDGAKGGGK